MPLVKIFNLKKGIRSIGQAAVALLYPPFCLHCREIPVTRNEILCPSCQQLLELIDPTFRCKKCFREYRDNKNGLCTSCSREESYIASTAFCFEYFGPAKTIIDSLKERNMPFLASGVAAFIFAQFCRFNWPTPDMVIPIPSEIIGFFSRGYNQAELIAEEMTKYLGVTYHNVLRKNSLLHRQSATGLKRRATLDKTAFSIIKEENLEDKKLLLIDDITYTGATIKAAAEALSAGRPEAVYALTFCGR